MDEPIARYILKCTPNVQCLVLANVGVVPVSHITSLQGLVKLSLFDSDVDDDMLTEIAQGCPQMQCLDFTYCSGLTNTGASAIVQGLRRLRALTLGANDLDSTVPQDIVLHHSASLEILYTSFNVNTDHVETLLRQCHHLRTLCFSIESVDFTQVMLSAFNNIKKLILWGALQRRLSASLLLLAPHCRKLEFLGLIPRSVYDPNGCAGLHSILTNCIHLHTLVLVEVGNEDEVLKLSAKTRATWHALRPNLVISYEEGEGEYPLNYNIIEE